MSLRSQVSLSAEPEARPLRRAKVSGRAIRLDRANVDTDLIIPSRYLKGLGREGLADGAFAALRESPDNPFDHPDFAHAPILIAGANFGCGSSREHAVWALQQIGIRAIIAPSFAPIFEANALRSGLLPVRLPGEEIHALLEAPPDAEFTVDVVDEVVLLPDGRRLSFTLEPFGKHCLLNGLDGVDVGLSLLAEIDVYCANTARERPWEQQVRWDRVKEAP